MTSKLFSLPILSMGLASWAVPFLAAFAFYTPKGELAVDLIAFKTAMILVGGLTGAALLVLAFRRINPGIRIAFLLGLSWCGLNWLLDLVVLVGLMGTPADEWIVGVGLRYLMLPIIATAMGAVARRQP